MSQSPLAPPSPPPARRLTHHVWLAAALLLCITVFAVLFLQPRPVRAPAAPPAPPPSGGRPGFLEHPPGPAVSPEALAEQAYLRALAAREAAGLRGGWPGSSRDAAGTPLPGEGSAARSPSFRDPAARAGSSSGDLPGGPDAAGAEGLPGDVELPGAPASSLRSAAIPRDLRRDSLLRALQAPLSRGAGSAAPAEPEGVALSRWLSTLPLPPGAGTEASALAASAPPPVSSAQPSREAAAAPPSVSLREPLSRAEAGQASSGLAGPAFLPSPARAPLPGFAAAAAGAGATRPSSGTPASSLSAPPGSRDTTGGTTLPVRFHSPLSPTTLPAGTLIPALLLTAVVSDLPGNLLAQVSRDVYDFRQQTLLLPRGTRLLGRYDSQVALGQRRLLVAWTRLVLPDGSGFDLPGLPPLPAVDPAGAAGLPAHTDNHLLRTFGDALLLSLLSAGAQLSQPQQAGLTAAPSAGNVAAAALGQELASAGLELLHRDLALQPTLSLPAATPFEVFVNGDIDLAFLLARGRSGEPRAPLP